MAKSDLAILIFENKKLK